MPTSVIAPHMKEASQTIFVQRLRRFPSYHIHRGKFEIQSVTICYDDIVSNVFTVISASGEVWNSGALKEGVCMISFILEYSVISQFESKGNLDLSSADLEIVSSASAFFINSIEGKPNRLTMRLLEKSNKELLREVKLSHSNMAIPLKQILKIPMPNVRTMFFNFVSYPEAISEMAKRWTDTAPETKMTIKMRGSFNWMLNFKTSFFSKILEESQDKFVIETDSRDKVIELKLLDFRAKCR
ncbi:Protein CBG25788 [Caenorhabditis briggsae]|uniref:Protein CBG25788 n=1 Tax=Caenorhabditis briggsae TaxID=6238 RepID=B6IGL1_CAEBR|nr:Protein CBG25788 [Caenorhabditis briggsae]CAR99041.1 Protein CBG25788 [Caenorhabditis briggsae]